MDFNASSWTLKRIFGIVGGVIALITALILIPQMVIVVDASEIVVLQSVSGDLTVMTDPGPKWQGFGKVTRYPRRDTFHFELTKDGDQSIATQFNDGGNGKISGTIQFEMPLKPDLVIRLHKDYNSIQAIEHNLIRQGLGKTIYNIGPTMSSTESAAEKRTLIPAYIDDQMVHGPYLTKAVSTTVKDPITGQEKTVNALQIVMDDKGKPARESESQITRYGITLQAVGVTNILYDDIVRNQIKQRQEAATAVQLSIANAKRAEQEAITTAREGERDAAKAKWGQEVVNAKEIADAEKKVKVAENAVKEAELYKKSEVLRGEGEAARKRLVMEADGQLDKKLEAVVKINSMYADAIKSAAPGAWAPQVVMGGSGQGNGGQNAAALVDLMTAKTAKELGIDLQLRSGAATKK